MLRLSCNCIGGWLPEAHLTDSCLNSDLSAWIILGLGVYISCYFLPLFFYKASTTENSLPLINKKTKNIEPKQITVLIQYHCTDHQLSLDLQQEANAGEEICFVFVFFRELYADTPDHPIKTCQVYLSRLTILPWSMPDIQ